MPPEPLPWERRDFVFRERKNERGLPYSDAVGSSSSSSGPRWREPYYGPRDFPSPRRPLSGYGRHGGSGGGYHQLLPDEPGGHGWTPSRSEGEGFRSYPGRYGSGGGRSSYGREGRGYFRRTSSDASDPPRPQHRDSIASAQRSADDPLLHPSSSSSHHLPLKDHHDKTGGGVDDGARTGQGYDRDREVRDLDRDQDHSLGSISWRPLKWTRSGSFSSSSKASRSEVDEGRPDESLPSGKETPVRSPVTSPPPLEEGSQKKKPRLGWGQGLAKYEKEKVEGPEDGSEKNGLVQCSNNGKASVCDTSPKLTALAGSTSPATPSSVACSSSGGVEEKPCLQAANDDAGCNVSNSPGHGCQTSLDGFSINSEHLQLNSVNDIDVLIAGLVQPEDNSSADSNFTGQTAMNKLLLLKGDILKVLEKTESDIDLFENELKKLNCECERSIPCQSLSHLQADNPSKPSEQIDMVASKMPITSTLLKDCLLDFPAASSMREPLLHSTLEIVHKEAKEQLIDSPETATSKFGKTSSVEKGTPDTGTVKLGLCLGDVEANSSVVPDGSLLVFAHNGDMPVASCAAGSDLDLGNRSVHVNSVLGSRDGEYCSLIAAIMASNKDSARKASEVLDEMLPGGSSPFDIWSLNNLLSYRRKETQIKEKLAAHKCFLRFKERVLTLKFRAFHHLWKEDLRLLSMRKHRPKAKKQFELSWRLSQNGYQKHRLSIRSRFSLPAGNLTLVPTTEIMDFTSKLLSDSQIRLYRDNLKMPALILDERVRRHSRFISKNGLIEDPCSFDKERAMINPWMPEEKEIFLEMLATFGKDFSKIASFLSHKTTADCVEFYYRNHKSECFKEVKKTLDLRKQWRQLPTNNYLVTSGKKWKREMNSASLDMLEAVSIIAAQADDNTDVQQKFSGKSAFVSHRDPKMSGGYTVYERADSVEVLGHERETTAADVLVGICGGLSSEAMSSCITTADPGDQMNRVTMNQPILSEVARNIDGEDTCSDEGCGEVDSVDWTDEEKSIFIRALSSYGRDFLKISHCVGTRSREQCKIFFSKARKCLGLDVFYQVPGNSETPINDANGGRSDTDDAGMAEMDSAICSTQSCSKMEVEFTEIAVNKKNEWSGEEGTLPCEANSEKSGEWNEVRESTQFTVEVKAEKLALISTDHGKIPTRKEDGPQPEVVRSETIIVASRTNGSLQLNEAVDLSCGAVTKEHGNNPSFSPSESVSKVGFRRVEQLSSHAAAEALQGDAQRVHDDGLKAELEQQKLLVPETGFDDRQQHETCSEEKVINSHDFVTETNADGNANHLENKHSPCPSIIFLPSYPHDVLPFLPKKSQMISWKQKENSTGLSVKMLPDASSLHFDPHQADSRSTLNFQEQDNKQLPSTVSRDFCQQYFLGNQSLTGADQTVHILRGLPLCVLNKKDMNGDLGLTGDRAGLQSLPKKSEKFQSNQFMQVMHGENCNGLSNSQLDSGLPFLHKTNEQVDAQLTPSSQSTCSEMEEWSARTGDVKLFGQILSHPSPVRKLSCPQESHHKLPPPKPSKIFSSKLSSGQADTTLPSSRPESSTPRGLEEFPLRNYGFWDGNRIQTIFPSMPESAVFLSKYPGALGGLSCYPAKDSAASNGVLSEYQHAYLQPFSLDGKRKNHGIFCDLQKHSGFETVSGFQNQGRVSVTRVGGGGILVGGGNCTGISDPVAAIKMHYAGRTGVLSSSEEDSWRGDIGGR